LRGKKAIFSGILNLFIMRYGVFLGFLGGR
jgi:hypothetical protein